MAKPPEFGESYAEKLGRIADAYAKCVDCSVSLTGCSQALIAFSGSGLSSDLDNAYNALAQGIAENSNAISFLFALIGAEGLTAPIFMRDLGRKLALENPPASIPATLFSPSIPAPPVWPESWPATMVSAAKAANVLAGNPVLNGGPFGV